MKRTNAKRPTEVTRTIPARELIRQMLPPFPHIEVREKQNGTWTVWYPDPAWIPCAPSCNLRERDRYHKHDFDQPFIQTHYVPTSYSDALAWAESLADGREVKILPYMTLAERKAASRERQAA